MRKKERKIILKYITEGKAKECIICRKPKAKHEFSEMKESFGEICKDCLNGCRISFKRNVKAAINGALQRSIKKQLKPWKYNPENRQKLYKYLSDYKERYPEKAEAWKAISNLPKPKGHQYHHWSYNEQHYLDVIVLKKEKHYIIHKYIEYDPESKMYKDKRSGFLLNTKSLHAAFLDLCLETYHGMKL